MSRVWVALGRRMLMPGLGAGGLALVVVWLLATAGLRPLMLPDEGRYVGVAWEMFVQGHWLVPTLDGLPFFHKPPLFYWVTRLGLSLFGVHPCSARLASLLGAVLIAIALQAFMRRRGSGVSASLTLAVLVSQPFFFIGAQFANLDMLVAAMISLTVLALADAALALEQGQPHRGSLALGGVFAALGVLAKGLIGVVLPVAVLLTWLAWRRRWRVLPRLLHPVGLVPFLVLSVPWFWWMQRLYPGFWDYFFVYHHFRRFTEVGFNNQQPFWFYLPVLLLFTIPWSPWLLGWLRGRLWRTPDPSGVRSLMVCWLLVILVFFSLPKSKLVGYVLAALPPLAYLLAQAIGHWLDRWRSARALAWLGGQLAAAAVLCLGLVAGLTVHNPSQLNRFAALSTQRPDPEAQLVMLDEYAYDLPYYLGLRRPPWVVSNWQDKAIASTDNWRKELADAGQFAPGVASARLLNWSDLLPRLCEPTQTPYWLWGGRAQAQRVPVLTVAEEVFNNGKSSLWRLDPAVLQRSGACSASGEPGRS